MRSGKQTVGIVGLGTMGGAFARNLVAAGFQVIGFDVEPAPRPADYWRAMRDNRAFWAVAAVLYLTVYGANRLAFIALFVLAAIFLILGIGAAARVYTVLQPPKSSMMGQPRGQRAH